MIRKGFGVLGIVLFVGAILVLGSGAWYYFQRSSNSHAGYIPSTPAIIPSANPATTTVQLDAPRYFHGLLQRRLAECESLPNNSTQSVVDTTRVFINIPMDLYPSDISTTLNGATAGYISNGGPYGHAMSVDDKPNCWGYYLEFDLTGNVTGTVDIAAKSGMSGVPDYGIHFTVSPN